jgi:molecular chaperone DnaK (HSP70)
VRGNINIYISSTIQASKAKLSALHENDQMQVKIAVAKNNLESYIYEVRGKLDDEEIEKVSTEEQREELRALLSESEEWIGNAEADGDAKFVAKLDEIKAKAYPIFFRLSEIGGREHVKESFAKLLEYTR